jgi:phosphopantetheine binding protein
MRQLPESMAPSAFVMLQQLPRTISGKIDRKALPSPAEMRNGAESRRVEPRTLVEEIIAGIWEGVLVIKGVGVHDNFFESGGHSLLATQVISRIIESFRVEVPLRSMFETPTIAGLASLVTRLQSDGVGCHVDVIPRIDRLPEETLPENRNQLSENCP